MSCHHGRLKLTGKNYKIRMFLKIRESKFILDSGFPLLILGVKIEGIESSQKHGEKQNLHLKLPKKLQDL